MHVWREGGGGGRPLQEGEDGKEGWERVCGACLHEKVVGRKGADRDEKRKREPRASSTLVYSRLITITARSVCVEEGEERCAHASHSLSLSLSLSRSRRSRERKEQKRRITNTNATSKQLASQPSILAPDV